MIQATGASDLAGAAWRKSRHSNPNGACVEMAPAGDGLTAVRDSTDPAGPALILGTRETRALLRDVRSGTLGSLA